MSKKLQEQLQKYKDNIDKVPYAHLKNELTMGAFSMGQAKPIDDYVKGIELLMKEKYEREKVARKAEKEADKERYINSLSPEDREQYLIMKETRRRIQEQREAKAAAAAAKQGEMK